MFLLQLHADQSGEWYEIDPTGNVVTHTSVPSLSDCPKISQNAPLVILLPGEQVTVTTVKLPKIRASERLRAIPFALEEQLACDLSKFMLRLVSRSRVIFFQWRCWINNILINKMMRGMQQTCIHV